MNRRHVAKLRRRQVVLAALLAGLMPALQAAQPGALVGLITDAQNVPVAHVTVTAVAAGGEAIRATLSGSDGVYSFGDLPAGNWSVSVVAPGYGPGITPALGVVPG
jgi:hypothetical protein